MSVKHIKIHLDKRNMEDSKRTLHVCFDPEQIKLLEKFGKSKGMLTLSQTIEYVIGKE